MHVDESKKFDKRSVERKIREGVISQKEYEDYLASLPDVADKVYNPQEESNEGKASAEAGNP